METTQTTDTAVTRQAIKPGRFSGMLGALQVAAYGEFKRHGMTSHIAHKVAMDYGSDLGNAMKHKDSDFNSKVSKANKEGARGFKITGKTPGVTESRAMSLKVITQHLDALFDEGKNSTRLLVNRPLLEEHNLNETLQEYLSDCEVWANSQTWDDTE